MQVQSTTLRKKGNHIARQLRQTLEYFLKERRLKNTQISDYEIYTKLGISKAIFYREGKRGEVEELISDLELIRYILLKKHKKNMNVTLLPKALN